MSEVVKQALWFVWPITLAGLTHVAAIRLNVFPRLAARRLDGGRCLRGRPIFGRNKTLRGAVVMVTACVFWVWVADRILLWSGLERNLRFVDWQVAGSFVFGGLLGLAYVGGELPNSFFKRQLDIGPGQPASGWLRKVFWVIDQIDSAVAVLLALCLFRCPSWPFSLVIVGLTLLIHPMVAAVMMLLGLKQRVG